MQGRLMRVNESQISWNSVGNEATSVKRVTMASAGHDEVDENTPRDMR